MRTNSKGQQQLQTACDGKAGRWGGFGIETVRIPGQNGATDARLGNVPQRP